MIKELLYKWFGIEERCRTCEILQAELDHQKRFNDILLGKLLRPGENIIPEKPVNEPSEIRPIAPSGGRRFMPHAVKQQLSEREDMKTLELLIKSKKEIQDAGVAKLEEEVLGKEQDDASKISEAI